MVRFFKLDQGEVAEQMAMAFRGPKVVHGAFDIEIVAGDAGPRERHRSPLAVVIGDGSERSRVEADELAEVEPGDEFMNFFVERGGIEIPEHGAGMAAAPSVASELDHRKACRLDAAR